MPFRPSRLPEQIRAAQGDQEQAVNAPATFSSSGAAQLAKQASSRWQRSGIDNPRRDSAPAWFAGQQPFSELRAANQDSFNEWSDRFRNATAMGFDFAPPPPEPAPSPPAGGAA